MNMEQYTAAAMRTSPRDGHDKIDNGALGLIGETGELVDVIKKYKYQSGANPEFPTRKIVDELGDVLWYLVELADGMNLKLYDVCNADFAKLDEKRVKYAPRRGTPESTIIALHSRATELYRAAHLKAWQSVHKRMQQMLFCAAHIARMCGYTLEEVARLNIRKLQNRYPDGFDAERSVERMKESMKEWHGRY